jgi:hypothetical protein
MRCILRLGFLGLFGSNVFFSSVVETNALAVGSAKRNKKSIPVLIRTTQEIILPGETKTFWTDESTLIAHSLSQNFGVLGVGHFVDEDDLMEIASLCEIRKCDAEDELLLQNDQDRGESSINLLVTVECVGRVKLQRLVQQYPYTKFDFSLVEEHHESHLEECQLVKENIETFMKILPYTKQGGGEEDDDQEFNLMCRYREAYDRILTITSNQYNRSSADSMKHLIATSWAAFTVVKDSNLDHYRMRALDYDNIFDRLKLAQNMLREKELRLQGMTLKNEFSGESRDCSKDFE